MPECPQALQAILDNFLLGVLGEQQDWFQGLAEGFSPSELKALEQEIFRRKHQCNREWEKLVNIHFVVRQALGWHRGEEIILPTPQECQALRQKRKASKPHIGATPAGGLPDDLLDLATEED